jgi:NTE family protein
MANVKRLDAVFEGGGVKGIGLVGAVSVVEAHGYAWNNLAGTSAGAMVAALVASGYSAGELKRLIGNLDYAKFKDPGAIDRIPVLGPLISLWLEKGIYEGRYVKQWMQDALAAKGIHRFGDLRMPGEIDPRYRYKLNVITSDISNGQLVVLPNGLTKYGLDPDQFPVAEAVRLSMSIPFFFKPVRLGAATCVDGGILSNFPVWLFDSPGEPPWPTFGFKLIEPGDGQPNNVESPLGFAKAIIGTMMDAHDKLHVEDEDWVRTIAIPTLGVRTTEFDLSPERRDALYQSGVQAAAEFFQEWDFEGYVGRYRRHRSERYLATVHRLQRNLVAG